MRRNFGIIPWICGAATIVLGTLVLFTLLERDNSIDILVGTYGENIYMYSFDTESQEFLPEGKAEAENASYALSDGDGNIYAVSEVGVSSGAYSFSFDNMTAEKRQTGDDPCFVLLHKGLMMTADYTGGSVSVFPIKEDKSIGDISHQLSFVGSGPVESRQEGSHIHQLRLLPGSQEWILASDLGADMIRLLHLSDENELTYVDDILCPAGSGPRHMEFSKDGKMLYCIAELSGNVLAYSISYDASEKDIPFFTLVQTIQADEVNAGGSADIHLHPDGVHLYTSHRLDNDGISIFEIQPDGTLEKTGYARTARHPRNFMITPDGEFLMVACRDDRVIQVFKIGKDGSLTLTPSVLTFDTDLPSSITLM